MNGEFVEINEKVIDKINGADKNDINDEIKDTRPSGQAMSYKKYKILHTHTQTTHGQTEK